MSGDLSAEERFCIKCTCILMLSDEDICGACLSEDGLDDLEDDGTLMDDDFDDGCSNE